MRIKFVARVRTYARARVGARERERERERDDGTYLDEKLVLNIFFDRVAIKVRACARGRRKERRFGRHVMEPGVPSSMCVCVCSLACARECVGICVCA